MSIASASISFWGKLSVNQQNENFTSLKILYSVKIYQNHYFYKFLNLRSNIKMNAIKSREEIFFLEIYKVQVIFGLRYGILSHVISERSK